MPWAPGRLSSAEMSLEVRVPWVQRDPWTAAPEAKVWGVGAWHLRHHGTGPWSLGCIFSAAGPEHSSSQKCMFWASQKSSGSALCKILACFRAYVAVFLSWECLKKISDFQDFALLSLIPHPLWMAHVGWGAISLRLTLALGQWFPNLSIHQKQLEDWHKFLGPTLGASGSLGLGGTGNRHS